MMMNRRGVVVGTVASGLCASPLIGVLTMTPATAQSIEGATSLSVRPRAGVEDVQVFDAAMLGALRTETFRTSTIWTEGVTEFSGPTLASILNAAGAGPGDLQLRAENDYVVAMPRTFVEDAVPIVATHRNGARFSRRDKGPLWLVFPYDDATRFQREDIYAYSVWQLVGIDIVAA